jgi:ubiquinone/menaquinone biosynthesis C-methylase UbiE
MTHTDFNKVRSYYAGYNEWDRLSAPEGRLELEMACEILDARLPPNSRVLDLGGGPGRYTVYLAKKGHAVTLANLSPDLLDIARQKIEVCGVGSNVETIHTANATDLGTFSDQTFDAVLAFGPYYHLVNETERVRSTSEISRVLKRGGYVFAAFVPRLGGVAGLISRASARPNQVTADTFRQTVDTGIFQNADTQGFQEGYYPHPAEMRELFESGGFTTECVRSLKGIGCNQMSDLISISENNPPLYEQIKQAIRETAEDPAVVAYCGHVLYVGQK